MKNKMPFFLGPCMLESLDMCLQVAEHLQKNLTSLEDKIEIYFKGSFDKANRSSIDSYRGPGLEEGLRILEKVREKTGLKVITDFHLPDQAEAVASVVDVLQIPAFLCRQTDMLLSGAVAAKKYGRILKMKKGQFISPQDTKNMVDKVITFLPKEKIYLTERGNTFGYNQLVVDMAGIELMKSFGVKVIFDATHSAQKPGGLGKSSGGARSVIPYLAKAAVAAGADGIFMEVHPNPIAALSDAMTQVPLSDASILVKDLVSIRELVEGQNKFQWAN